jgi:uncharacterized YigZ family protein
MACGLTTRSFFQSMRQFARLIAGPGQHELEIKKSRFICTIDRAASEAEARLFHEQLKKRYWDANHNCLAYLIGERNEFQKANDDGEPSGTAGVPMLEVLKKRELINTVVVVTRYFGGTKLGAGGLIRAYGQSVSDVIYAVGIVERRPFFLLTVRSSHQDAGRVENALRASTYKLGEVVYGGDVSFELHLDEDEIAPFRAWLAELTGGRNQAEVTGQAFIEVPLS